MILPKQYFEAGGAITNSFNQAFGETTFRDFANADSLIANNKINTFADI